MFAKLQRVRGFEILTFLAENFVHQTAICLMEVAHKYTDLGRKGVTNFRCAGVGTILFSARLVLARREGDAAACHGSHHSRPTLSIKVR